MIADNDLPGSPTTGAEAPGLNLWSNVKCVFCDTLLATNDQPRLLECLHTCCSACVSSKLNEPNHDTGDVVGRSFMVFFYNCCVFFFQLILIHPALYVSVEVNSMSCPSCSVVSTVGSIIDNQFLLELCMENDLGSLPDLNKSLSDLKCSSDSAPATSWCVDCAEFICDDCVQVPTFIIGLSIHLKINFKHLIDHLF